MTNLSHYGVKIESFFGAKRLLLFFSLEHAAGIEELEPKLNDFFQLRTRSSFFSLDRSCLKAKLNDFQPRRCSFFFFLWIEGCFGAKLRDFSASYMQLFFSLCTLWSKLEHAAVSLTSKRLL